MSVDNERLLEISELVYDTINKANKKSDALLLIMAAVLYPIANGFQHFSREKIIQLMNSLYSESLVLALKGIDKVKQDRSDN